MDVQPELIPVRMLNEFVYCPRLAYLEWVQGEWESNRFTAHGDYVHRRVDREGGDFSEAPFTVRAATLSDPELGIIARMDLLEGQGSEVVPVDYKRGSPPDNEHRSWEPERVQLCAQALILRANGFRCERGVLYFAGTRQRVDIPFDTELVELTRRSIEELKSQLLGPMIPSPLQNSPKCPGCSLVGICLPDEVHLLRSGEPAERHRRLLPPSDDALPLYLHTQGMSVGINGEVLEMRERGKTIGSARLIDTSQLCLFGNIQVSAQALRALADRDIPICYFTYAGWFTAMTTGLPHKNIELRRHQYRRAEDPEACVTLARRLVGAKILNSRTQLRRNNREVDPSVLRELKRLALAADGCPTIESLFGIEGMAARLYFSQFAGMLKSEVHFDFEGRNRRPPRDPVNAVLSLLYSLLAKELTITCLAVGLDPYLGFYHQPRYGRPSLALDLMEEFRPLLCDSVLLTLINNRMLEPGDFLESRMGVALHSSARRTVLQAYERRLDEPITHPVFGYRISYRQTLAIQVRLLARYLAGEIENCPQFLTR